MEQSMNAIQSQSVQGQGTTTTNNNIFQNIPMLGQMGFNMAQPHRQSGARNYNLEEQSSYQNQGNNSKNENMDVEESTIDEEGFQKYDPSLFNGQEQKKHEDQQKNGENHENYENFNFEEDDDGYEPYNPALFQSNVPQEQQKVQSGVQNKKINEKDLVQEQDLLYKQMQNEELQKQKEKQENLQLEQLALSEAKNKIENLLEYFSQPEKDGDIINIGVRLPSGKKIFRKFGKDEKIKRVFDFVLYEKHQEDLKNYIQEKILKHIQRQDEEILDLYEFEVMSTYPRLSLKEVLDKKFQEVFEDSTEELLNVSDI